MPNVICRLCDSVGHLKVKVFFFLSLFDLRVFFSSIGRVVLPTPTPFFF